MKETTKMSRAISQLEHMYNTLNIDFFNGELPVPIITIQSSPGTWGHCTRAKVWKSKDSDKYELNIAAELASACIEEILDTIIHEMVHLYCREHDIKETSRGGSYHNKKFKELAEERGLICVQTKSGWNTIGTGNDKLVEYALSKGWSELKISRSTVRIPMNIQLPNGNTTPTSTTSGTRTSSSRKLQCPNCKISCRATKDIRIMCMDCNEQMIEVQK